jgi:hypothetical protein
MNILRFFTEYSEGMILPCIARDQKRQGRSGLPGALLVTMLTQLLAPFMLVDFCLTAFLE